MLGVLLAALSTPTFAQNIYDNCRAVITDGLREYSVSNDSLSYLNTVFDKYCDRSGSTKTAGVGVGIDAVIKSIPVKFTGNYSSNEEGWRSFCRNYSSETALQTNRNNYQERIVERAYDSFDSCIALAAAGIVTRHRVENITRTNFFMHAGFARPVTIRGVNATSNIKCEGIDPNSKENKSTTFNAGSVMKLVNDDVLGMVCTRSGNLDAAGNTAYDEGIVTVLTDISPNGNYTIFMPRDTKLADNVASLVQKQIKETADSLDKSVKDLKAATNKMLTQIPNFVQNTDMPGYDTMANRGERFPGSKADCPAGHFVTGVESYVENGDGHVKTRLKCWRLPGLAVP
jgi:hypothetical protein